MVCTSSYHFLFPACVAGWHRYFYAFGNSLQGTLPTSFAALNGTLRSVNGSGPLVALHVRLARHEVVLCDVYCDSGLNVGNNLLSGTLGSTLCPLKQLS